MDGTGTFFFNNGTVYEGNWVAGKMEGNGVMKYNTGEEYTGEFKDNYPRKKKSQIFLMKFSLL
jgi:hypothetical protein